MTLLPKITVTQALEQRAAQTPDHVVLVTDQRTKITAGDLRRRAQRLASGLRRQGIGPGDQIVTLLNNSIEYVVIFLAACEVGAVWIPVNPEARGPVLGHILKTAQPRLMFVEDSLVSIVQELDLFGDDVLLASLGNALPLQLASFSEDPCEADQQNSLQSIDDLRCVIFTSGTTGPPKGVMVTERMLMAAAFATGYASKVEKDDVYHFWEPLYHIGGSQLVVLSLLQQVTLVLVPRFSASRFWHQVRQFGVTKLHYLGGLLDILLAQPITDADTDHSVTLGFGGGARPATAEVFETRFGIPLHEVYGMTEASSFSTLNDAGIRSSIGRSLPWFELNLVDAGGDPVAAGEIGELVVDDHGTGLITPGYLDAPGETSELIRDGKLWTGDLMRQDDRGYYTFVGRRRDFIRRRGENISAWEVEQALNQHPRVVDSAVIGVEATIGEQEIHAFVELDTDEMSVQKLHQWASARLGRHQLPRYWSQMTSFKRTPSQRIIKTALGVADVTTWDSEANNNV